MPRSVRLIVKTNVPLAFLLHPKLSRRHFALVTHRSVSISNGYIRTQTRLLKVHQKQKMGEKIWRTLRPALPMTEVMYKKTRDSLKNFRKLGFSRTDLHGPSSLALAPDNGFVFVAVALHNNLPLLVIFKENDHTNFPNIVIK